MFVKVPSDLARSQITVVVQCADKDALIMQGAKLRGQFYSTTSTDTAMPSLLEQFRIHQWFRYPVAQLETPATRLTLAAGVGTNKPCYTRAAALAEAFAHELEFGMTPLSSAQGVQWDLLYDLLPLYRQIQACPIGASGTFDLFPTGSIEVTPNANMVIDFALDWTA